MDNSGVPKIKSQFYEDHKKDISFFYTGKANVIGRDYADAVITNTRNAHYIRIATISYDSTIQPTDENIVNEEFLIRYENQVTSQYVANEATIKLVSHIVGKRVDRDRFKCILTPELEYLSIPEIRITEELTADGYIIGVWMHTEGIKRIYLTRIHSHARNSYPLNSEYIDSKYYINLLENSEIQYDVDTTNLLNTVSRNQIGTGVNIYSTIDRRLTNLEAIRYPDIRFCTVSSDSSWTPEVTGSISREYQRIPMVNVNYGMSLSTPFVNLQVGAVKGFSVNSEGLYQVQYTNDITTLSAVEDSVAETALFKNNDIVPGTSMIRKLKGDYGDNYMNDTGAASSTALLHLTTTDIVRLQFKFIHGFDDGVINRGCKVQVTKLLQIP